MINEKQSLLSKIQEHWAQIEKDTLAGLGEGPAQVFVDLWNDSFTICDAVGQSYTDQERLESLLCFRLENCLTFCMELYWLQMLFSYANYPIVFQRLRFLWEMIYRAYYADTYKKRTPADPDGPGPSLDDKCCWLQEQEESHGLHWGNVIFPTLCKLFPLAAHEEEVEQYYHQLWKRLNEYVHPSNSLLEKMIDRQGLPVNRFNKDWAKETIQVATTVLDLVWLAVFQRFPAGADRVAQVGLIVEYPMTTSILKNIAAG